MQIRSENGFEEEEKIPQGFFDQSIADVVNPAQFGFLSAQPAQSRGSPRFRHNPHWHPHWNQCPFENENNWR